MAQRLSRAGGRQEDLATALPAPSSCGTPAVAAALEKTRAFVQLYIDEPGLRGR